MDPGKLKVGETYYLLTFFDEKLRFPSIGTFIYLGKDILENQGDDKDIMWVFQTAQSYVGDGPYDPKLKGSMDALLLATSDMIGKFLSRSELIERLQSFG